MTPDIQTERGRGPHPLLIWLASLLLPAALLWHRLPAVELSPLLVPLLCAPVIGRHWERFQLPLLGTALIVLLLSMHPPPGPLPRDRLQARAAEDRLLEVKWLQAPASADEAGLLLINDPQEPVSSKLTLRCMGRHLLVADLPLPMTGERWLLHSTKSLWQSAKPACSPVDRQAERDWTRGRAGWLKPPAGTRLRVTDPGGGWRDRLEAQRLRLLNALQGRLRDGTGAAADWLQAMLLGQRDELGELQQERLRRTGLAHLLALSGLHVGLVMLALGRLAALLLPGARLRWLVLLAALPAFAWLTGGMLSVRRAALMGVLLLAARLLGRRARGPDLLLAAMVVLLLADPGEVMHPGFQLSFCAVGALVSMKSPARIARAGIGARSLVWLQDMWRASWRVSLATAPVLLLHFRELALAGPLLNLVAIPLASLLVLTGLLHLVLPLPGEPLGQLAHLLARSLDGMAATVPAPRLVWSPVPVQLILVSLATLLLLVRWRGSSVPAALACCLLAGDLLPRSLPPAPFACMLHVGQGDAILLCSPAGRRILVDCGWARPDAPGGSARGLLAALDRLAPDGLDWLVLTHPDQDHLGGAQALVERLPIGSILFNGEWKENLAQRALQASIASVGTALVEGVPGMLLQAEPGWRLRVLGPPPAAGPCEAGNERSIVLLLESRAGRLLLTGDAGFEEEAWLLGWGERLDADWLKLGHHGSRGSSSGPFLDATSPREVWISCSRDNRYGHPHPELLHRLEARNLEPWQSHRQGFRWLWLDPSRTTWMGLPAPRLLR